MKRTFLGPSMALGGRSQAVLAAGPGAGARTLTPVGQSMSELKAAGTTDTSSCELWNHHRNRHSHRTESLAHFVEKTSY